MSTLNDLHLLGDQILVRCLGTADKQGSVYIPESAQEARKVHQSGGDYIHRGEVVKCGPGDKTVLLICASCRVRTLRSPKRIVKDADVFSLGKCYECGGELRQMINHHGMPVESRHPMQTRPGYIILYERRRDAMVDHKRFPSLDDADESLVILLEEQHVLAILETAAERQAVAA